MTYKERLTIYYEKGWATKEQIAQYVVYRKITAADYTEITGEAYVS